MNNITESYLQEIRQSDGLKNAILVGITVDEKRMKAEFFLVTDRTHTSEEEERALAVTKKVAPSDFSVSVRIVKRVADEEILRDRIYEFMQKNFPAASAFFEKKDVHIERMENGAVFSFDIASGEQSLFSSGNILDEVSRYLQSTYPGTFYGNVRVVEKERVYEEEQMLEEAFVSSSVRTFPVEGFEKIDGADEIPTTATYIADVEGEKDNVVICGKILFMQEKISKKGKTYYTLSLDDGSGTMRLSYFPKKLTIEKIQALQIGDFITVIGANERYNDNLSFTAKKINYGRPPVGFVPQKKEGKPVPMHYHTVFPEPYVDYTQTGFFDRQEKPKDLKENVFVVFDLETTGTNNNPAMGKPDKIIEIGAVKLVGGEVVEKFSSFVACPDKLPAKIVELTGIVDEDLVGAPTIEEVLPDFCKFVGDAYLVAHNAPFDCRFIRLYGGEQGYYFENREFDTCDMARELLRGEVSNFKLNTIADYYGFSFHHHRAYEDALVTAKCFIELVKKRKTLPL